MSLQHRVVLFLNLETHKKKEKKNPYIFFYHGVNNKNLTKTHISLQHGVVLLLGLETHKKNWKKIQNFLFILYVDKMWLLYEKNWHQPAAWCSATPLPGDSPWGLFFRGFFGFDTQLFTIFPWFRGVLGTHISLQHGVVLLLGLQTLLEHTDVALVVLVLLLQRLHLGGHCQDFLVALRHLVPWFLQLVFFKHSIVKHLLRALLKTFQLKNNLITVFRDV